MVELQTHIQKEAGNQNATRINTPNPKSKRTEEFDNKENTHKIFARSCGKTKELHTVIMNQACHEIPSQTLDDSSREKIIVGTIDNVNSLCSDEVKIIEVENAAKVMKNVKVKGGDK